MRWLHLAGYAFPGVLLLSAAHKLGIDPNALVTAMLVGSPILAVAVVSLVVHAWRQNSVTAIASDDRSDAEPPGQVDQANPGQVATPASRATVTSVEVLPLPTGHADSQSTAELCGHHPIPLGYLPDPGRVAIAKAIEPRYTPRTEDTDAH